MAAAISARSVPRAFVWRRLHSLTGLIFLLFLMEHMFTNSQAAIFFGARAMWFVNSVNFLHNIPYLPLVEALLLGVPMALHAVWGVIYMMTAKSNATGRGGKTSHQKYERNKAYSLHRITAWLILIGVIFHVAQMRFIMYPFKVHMGNYSQSFGKYLVNPGLYTVADQLKVSVYDSEAISREQKTLERMKAKMSLVDRRIKEMGSSGELQSDSYSAEASEIFKNVAAYNDKKEFIKGLTYFSLKPNEVIITSTKSADLILLNVRQAFQSIWMCAIYTLFVLSSVFHGCNGFWTFCITWGLLISRKAQKSWVNFVYGLAFVMLALGMLSIWGSYFFTTGYFN